MGKLKIYTASAGTGKTQQLTLEYLKLSLQNPYGYRNILGVTFTNKATEEMKNRIIKELYKISNGLEPSLADKLLEAGIKKDKISLQQAAHNILGNILYDYSNFDISTIDSFFQKILRNFIRETGLRAGYQPEMDIDSVLDKAITMLYADIGKDQQLTDWLTRFAEENIEAGKNWNLKNEIKNFSYEITKENFAEFTKEIEPVIKDKKILSEINKKLIEQTSVFENTMSTSGKKALKIIDKYALSQNDFYYGKNGFINYFYKIANKTSFEPSTRCYDAINNPDKWTGPKSTVAIKENIINSYNEGLNEILQSAIAYYEQNYINYNSTKIIKGYFNIIGLLIDLAAKLKIIRDEENILLLSDANILLRSLISDNDAPFIYEKTGSFFNHFLIDEFQDTSVVQWENFRPLLLNGLSLGQSSAVVGDIKQSIYRWRGGDWNLLLNNIYDDIGASFTETMNLSFNWRSNSNIINFNNSLFLSASHLLANVFDSNLEEQENGSINLSGDIIIKAYQNSPQLVPKEKKADDGYVNIRFFDRKNDEDKPWKEQVNENLPIAIDDILEKNYCQGDITILVRTAKEGRQIADVLLSCGKYNIISRDSVFLESSPAVRLLISILKFINNGNDIISKMNIVKEYVCNILKTEDTGVVINHFAGSEKNNQNNYFESSLPEEFISKNNRLNSLTLYDLVEQLIRIFRLNEHKGELIFIQSFQDLLLTYSSKYSPGIGNFIEWWDNKGSGQAIQLPDDIDAIRIMTIHKAKGLDFKILVIPYCDWRLEHNTSFDNIIWSSAAASLIKPLKLIPVKYKSDLAKSLFSKDYYYEKLQCFIDNLNLLYVAFTRPVDGLVAMAPVPSGDKIKSIADLLFYIISNYDESIIAPDQLKAGYKFAGLKNLYSEKEKQLVKGSLPTGKDPNNKSDIQHNYIPENIFSSPLKPGLKVKKHAVKMTMDSERKIKIDYGKFMHEILSKIKHKSDTEKELNELYFNGQINLAERKELINKLDNIFSVKPEWFSGGYSIKTENPIILNKGKIIIPDRVLINGNNVTVIDFKFGEEQPEHRKQVENYINILKEMGYETVEGYLFYAKYGKVLQV